MQDDNYIKLEKVLKKIAFIPLSRLIDLTVTDYKILNRAKGSEIVTVAYNNGINLHQLCKNEMEIVNCHNAKKKDKILRKVKALKAKLKSSPSNRRSTVYQYRAVEPIARDLASNIVENLVESHIEEESAEARNVNSLQNEFSELLQPGSAIENVGNEFSNDSMSFPMNQITNPFSTEVNLCEINSIENVNPPRVVVNYEEAVETRPEMFSPEPDDFGNADIEDIVSLGFERNMMSSIGIGRNVQSAELLHRSSALYARSSMCEDVAIPQIILDGDVLEPSSGASISRNLIASSTLLSPQNHILLEKSEIAMPDCNRTPIALASSSVIIPPFSRIEHEDSLPTTNYPQPDDTLSKVSTNSRRLLIFNNIQETLPVQVLQHRRRRAQRVHDYDLDILNIVDDLMLLNSPSVIPESIMKQPHENPRLFKTPLFIDTDLTFEFDLLKISKENPNIQSQSNLPIINNYSDTRLINPIDNDIQERPLETIQDYDNIRPRPSVAIQDDDNIQLQRTVAIQDYDIIQPRTSATPADDNVAKHISDNLPQRNTIHSPVEEQNQFDERTGLQNRVTTPTNPIPGTSMSNAFDPVDGIRRITMNTPTGILNTSYQRFDLDKQQNISRISDLCEVPTPQFGEDIVPIENNDRQRFPSPTNQLLNTSKKLKPHKDIIHQGKQYVQFANGHKFSVYFLELTFLFYEIQQLFVTNGVHTMDADELIQEIRKDNTVQCTRIQLLNMCHNNLIDIIDDDKGEIAFINIPFLETTVEEDSSF